MPVVALFGVDDVQSAVEAVGVVDPGVVEFVVGGWAEPELVPPALVVGQAAEHSIAVCNRPPRHVLAVDVGVDEVGAVVLELPGDDALGALAGAVSFGFDGGDVPTPGIRSSPWWSIWAGEVGVGSLPARTSFKIVGTSPMIGSKKLDAGVPHVASVWRSFDVSPAAWWARIRRHTPASLSRTMPARMAPVSPAGIWEFSVSQLYVDV